MSHDFHGRNKKHPKLGPQRNYEFGKGRFLEASGPRATQCESLFSAEQKCDSFYPNPPVVVTTVTPREQCDSLFPGVQPPTLFSAPGAVAKMREMGRRTCSAPLLPPCSHGVPALGFTREKRPMRNGSGVSRVVALCDLVRVSFVWSKGCACFCFVSGVLHAVRACGASLGSSERGARARVCYAQGWATVSCPGRRAARFRGTSAGRSFLGKRAGCIPFGTGLGHTLLRR